MGAQLVGQAFAVASRLELKPHESLLLLGMAYTALDTDKEPRYFGARERSAIFLGRYVPDEPDPDSPGSEAVMLARAAAFKSVSRAVQGLTLKRTILGLTDARVIRLHKEPRIGQRAEYLLPLDLWEKIALSEPGQLKNVPLPRTLSVPLSGTKSVRGSAEKCPPKEPQEPLKELHRGEHCAPASTHVGYPQASEKDRLRLAS